MHEDLLKYLRNIQSNSVILTTLILSTIAYVVVSTGVNSVN
jgi:hypothetical protein